MSETIINSKYILPPYIGYRKIAETITIKDIRDQYPEYKDRVAKYFSNVSRLCHETNSIDSDEWKISKTKEIFTLLQYNTTVYSLSFDGTFKYMHSLQAVDQKWCNSLNYINPAYTYIAFGYAEGFGIRSIYVWNRLQRWFTRVFTPTSETNQSSPETYSFLNVYGSYKATLYLKSNGNYLNSMECEIYKNNFYKKIDDLKSDPDYSFYFDTSGSIIVTKISTNEIVCALGITGPPFTLSKAVKIDLNNKKHYLSTNGLFILIFDDIEKKIKVYYNYINSINFKAYCSSFEPNLCYTAYKEYCSIMRYSDTLTDWIDPRCSCFMRQENARNILKEEYKTDPSTAFLEEKSPCYVKMCAETVEDEPETLAHHFKNTVVKCPNNINVCINSFDISKGSTLNGNLNVQACNETDVASKCTSDSECNENYVGSICDPVSKICKMQCKDSCKEGFECVKRENDTSGAKYCKAILSNATPSDGVVVTRAPTTVVTTTPAPKKADNKVIILIIAIGIIITLLLIYSANNK